MAIGGLTIINFGGSGPGSGYNLFAPDPGASDPTGYSPVSSSLLAASQLSLQQEAGNGLAAISSAGGADFGTLTNLFSGWTNTNAGLFNTVAGDFTRLVGRTANASSGILGGIFGF